MEFSQPRQNQPVSTSPSSSASGGKRGKRKGFGWLSLTTGIFVAAAAILLIALTVFLVRGGTYGESELVNKNQYQAVFLNGGQVYFGKVGDLNSKYMTMSDIYYLRVNQTVQPNQTNNQSSNDVSLVKLGCELHGPQDQMVINRDMVIFWENLKGDGQVAKAVTEYKKQNPQGQNCNTANQSTNTNTNSTNKQ
jgi:hypothetical protein